MASDVMKLGGELSAAEGVEESEVRRWRTGMDKQTLLWPLGRFLKIDAGLVVVGTFIRGCLLGCPCPIRTR